MSYIARELKPTFERLIEPLVMLLKKLGATPNAITVAGLVFVVIGSYFLYLQEYFLSFIFLLVGALSDAIDGSLARRAGKSSDFGAFLDSLLDRVSDAIPFIAIALSAQDKLLSLLALTSLVFSYTVSYSRARAEGLGYELKVGLFERPERWTILLVGIILQQLLITLSIITIGSLITTLQRAYTFKKLQRR